MNPALLAFAENKPLPFRQFTGNPNDPWCAPGYCHPPVNGPEDLKFVYPNSFAPYSDKVEEPFIVNPPCPLDPLRTEVQPCNDIFYSDAFKKNCHCKASCGTPTSPLLPSAPFVGCKRWA